MVTLKKCCGCHAEYTGNDGCLACGCRLFTEGHPIFGFDTPESITESVETAIRDVKKEYNGKAIKAAIMSVLQTATKIAENTSPKEIDNYVEACCGLTRAYAHIVITTMPIIDGAMKAYNAAKEEMEKAKANSPS